MEKPLWKTAQQLLKKVNIPTLWPSSSTPSYLLKRNKNMSSQKCLNKNIYRRFSYSRQKLGTTKMSTNRRMDKQIVVYLQDGRLLSNQRCCRTHAHCNSDRFQSTSVWGKEASHRNVYPAWFHIYKVLQQEKVIYGGKKIMSMAVCSERRISGVWQWSIPWSSVGKGCAFIRTYPTLTCKIIVLYTNFTKNKKRETY